MNMSDDVSGAVISTSTQLVEKGIEAGAKAFNDILDKIAQLLRFLMGLGKNKSGGNSVQSSDMTDINAGTVEIGALAKNAKTTGDTLVPMDGLSKEDAAFLASQCKQAGIPIAFTTIGKNKDNICACVRGSDKAIFDKIMTECIKDKLDRHPKDYSMIKVDKWQIEGIRNELRDNDLCANVGQLKNGDYFFLCKKSEEKAVLMARGQFQRKCKELDENFSVTKVGDGVIMGGENAGETTQVKGGFFVIRDAKGAEELSFDADNIPSRSELAKQISETFGYDANKAELAADKFAEENLSDAQKARFLSGDPGNAFAKIETNIEYSGEDAGLVSDYSCMRLTEKSDGVPKLVYADEAGNYAVLRPEKQTREEMGNILRGSFAGIDDKTVDALTDKAVGVTDYYSRQGKGNLEHTQAFPQKEVLRDEKSGFAYYAGTDSNLHASKVNTSIDRTGKNTFTIKSDAVSTKLDADGKELPLEDRRDLTLSFSDKKSALSDLKEMYKGFGVPDHAAHKMAKEVFNKAQAQSAEKVVQIEKIRVESKDGQEDTVTAGVVYGSQKAEVDLTDPEKAKEDLSERFGISPEEAENVLDRAQEKIEAMGGNGHEKNPSEVLNEARAGNATAPEAPKPNIPNADAPKADMPKMEAPAAPRKR